MSDKKLFFTLLLCEQKNQFSGKNCFSFNMQKVGSKKGMLRFITTVTNSLWYFSNILILDLKDICAASSQNA